MAAVARAPFGLTFGTTPCSAADSTKKTLAKEAAVAKCWQSFDSQNAKATPAIKEEVRRHGIPDCIRADAYYALSGAVHLQREHPQGTYSSLAASTSDLDEVIFSIEDDVRNVRVTFKDSRIFSTAKGAEALSRLIFAHIRYNPSCGYFKGLAHIAALLLAIFGREREEQAFWTLAALLKRRLFPACDGQVPLGSHVEARVLEQLLAHRLPALAALLAKQRPDAVEQLATAWFATAFTRALPQEVVMRVWDCVVVEGAKVPQRVAMALIKTCASSIQSCTSMETLCRVLDGRLARTADADALLSVAFKGLGSLSGSTVDAARSRALAQVVAARDQQRSRSGPPALAPLAPPAAAALGRAPSGALSVSSRGSNGGGSGSASSTSSGLICSPAGAAGAAAGAGGANTASSAAARTAARHAVHWPAPRSTGALLSMA